MEQSEQTNKDIMKENPSFQSGIFNPRVLRFFALRAVGSSLFRLRSGREGLAELVSSMAIAKQRPRSYFDPLLLCVVLICGLQVASASGQYNPVSFDGARGYPVLGAGQSGASAVATGDFNGDGKPDMVAATQGSDGVSVLLNNGDGTFGKAVYYATDDGPNYVAVADINGDGKLDLVTANGGGRSVSILLGNGDGTFQAPRNFAVGLIPNAVAIGDFNNDGKLDLAVADQAGGLPPHNALWIMLGNGDGTFQAPTAITMIEPILSVEVGDFNGDGKLDLVAGHSARQWILLGNGNGTFQAPVIIPGAGGSPYGNAVAVGDFNRDGKLDLAVADSSLESEAVIPGSVEILLGTGQGTFLPPLVVVTGTYPYSVRAADFNGDGKLDLAVANTGDATVSIFPGNGDGTFQSATTYPIGANWETTVAVADFNGDGQPDVAISSAHFSDNVSVLLSKGGGKFHSAALYAVGTQPYSIVTGDFNHDGKMDLATANSGSNNVSVLPGNGDGSFGAAVNYSVGKLPSSISTADFNHDGNLDLAVANHQDGTISILLGNSDGTFQTAVTYPAATNAIALVVADFNGDGKLDLAVGGVDASNNNEVAVLLGNGDGTFQAAINSLVPGTGIVAIGVGDFNGDGKRDLAFANYYSNNVVIMLGNGDATFRPAPNAVTVGAPGSVAVGDFNRDGKADLAVGTLGGSGITVFLGNGDGTFQPLPVNYAVGNDPDSIALADLNGDGIPDLAVGNVNDNSVSILQGKGDGTFQDALTYGVSRGPSALVVGDFNRDGKPDIATTGFWFGNVSVLLNNTPAVRPLNAVSRKTHAAAGTFDINLPLTGPPGIECRSGGAGGDHQIVISFPWAVTFSSAAVTNGAGTVSSTSGSGTNKVTVNLTGVANAQIITVTLFNVSDGPNTVDVPVRMGVLLGDVNASGVVTSGDTNLCKAQALQPVTASNFRNDVNASGSITTGDVNIIKQNALSHL